MQHVQVIMQMIIGQCFFFFLARFADYDAPVTGYSADLSASNNIILGVKIVFLFLNSRIE